VYITAAININQRATRVTQGHDGYSRNILQALLQHKVKVKENTVTAPLSIDNTTAEAFRYIARTKQRRTYLP